MNHYSPSYSVILRLRYPDLPGFLGRVASAIGQADGSIGAVDLVQVEEGEITRDIVVSARDAEHSEQIVERVRAIPGVTVVSVADRTFLLHQGGKIEVALKTPVKTRDDLSMVYTPGVARVCRAIEADPDASFSLTIRQNTVAVISDGSAVLGLGNIGAKAAMPVMEGKCMLFKEFGGVDAFPICLDTQDVDEIVRTCVCVGANLRRHQPGRHLLAALRRNRAAADRAVGDSGVSRRSARHGRRGPGGADERLEDRRQATRRRADRHFRGGRGRRGHRQIAAIRWEPGRS